MSGSGAFDAAGVCKNTESIFLKQCSIDINTDKAYTENTTVNPFGVASSIDYTTSMAANQSTFNADFQSIIQGLGNDRHKFQAAAAAPSMKKPMLGYSASGEPLGNKQLFSTANSAARF